MPWRQEMSRRARRDLLDLKDSDRAAVQVALDRLAADPSSADLKKLSGGAGWRLRIGQWRALVELDTRTGVMLVTRVLNRRDAYRG